ncbi:MAG: PAS domain-containing protein [bacterium]
MFPTLVASEGGLTRALPEARVAIAPAILARIFDRRLFPQADSGPVEQALGRTAELRAALAELPAAQSLALRASFGEAALSELLSLAGESDPALLHEALLSFAGRQETSGRVEIAAELYQSVVANAGAGSALGRRAQARLDAILGRGSVALRGEYLLRNLAQQACEPSSLLAMGAAGTIFRATRLLALSRLAASPTANFLTRGFGASALAGLAGFAVEAPAFTLSGRLAAEALGRSQDWSGEALRRDLLSSYLVLGGLRAAGFAGAGLYRRFGGSSEFARGLFAQGSMLTGILGAHWLETRFGLRPATDRANTLVDSLATLLQFNVAARLSHQAFGPRVAAWEAALDAQTQLVAATNFRASGPRGPGLSPAYAVAGGRAPEALREPEDPLGRGLQVLMSKMHDGKGNPGPTGRRLAPGEVGEGGVDPSQLDRQISTLLLSAGDNLERGLRTFIDGLPVATAVARLERGNKDMGRIFMVNRRFQELFGYTEREIGELPLIKFYHPLKSAFVLSQIWNIFRNGIFRPSDMELRHRDEGWVKVRGSGVVKDLGDHSIAFGFLENRAEANEGRQSQILAAFEESKRPQAIRTAADGHVEVGSVIELSSLLTQDNSALLRQIVDQDVRIRITNMPWVQASDGYAEPLARFFNVQDRKFSFPVGRRVSVEFPPSESNGRARTIIPLVKFDSGFRAIGFGGPEANPSGNPAGTELPTALPRTSPSLAAPAFDKPPSPIPPAVVDATTAELLTRLQSQMGAAVLGAREALSQQDAEVTVAGEFPAAFLNQNLESIQGELQAITEKRVPITLGRQVTLRFHTDRGPLTLVFRKVLRRFERVDG